MEDLKLEIEELTPVVQRVRDEVGRVLVGQRYMVDGLLLALIADGHVLLEGIPGLAKTTAIKSLAEAMHISFSRLQFTPDLLPADLTGTQIYRPDSQTFAVHQGPIFANLVLADEINRAPAKVQSALLEAMQERQVTIGDETFNLPSPFLVMATQNPIEQEGTYPLPEAQIDRFMLKLKVGYPSKDEEREIMRRMAHRQKPQVQPVLNVADLERLRVAADAVYIDARIEDYIVELVFATRSPADYGLGRLETLIEFGASPRATIFLAQGAKASALLAGRNYVTPQDVKDVGTDVLRHRILLTYEAEAQELDSDAVVAEILNAVDVP